MTEKTNNYIHHNTMITMFCKQSPKLFWNVSHTMILINTFNTNQQTLYVIESMVLKGHGHLHTNKKDFI